MGEGYIELHVLYRKLITVHSLNHLLLLSNTHPWLGVLGGNPNGALQPGPANTLKGTAESSFPQAALTTPQQDSFT